jgi:hypothetical protein
MSFRRWTPAEAMPTITFRRASRQCGLLSNSVSDGRAMGPSIDTRDDGSPRCRTLRELPGPAPTLGEMLAESLELLRRGAVGSAPE